ncbi:DUF2255 family protein [Cellulosimicrobium sp. TH-20]|uniref:DUF2255 family protein n=1 Tax=Cellulosimicrobium sp. TH-20 TaxID=1980001 RepID=UPI001642DCDE|nr:DUF2255 family protein [Cellulosimicrobium sp. TH-20]
MPQTDQALAEIGAASEIRIATRRRDGSTRRPIPIWIVCVDGEVYIRSYNGPTGSWYRQAITHPYAEISANGHTASVQLTPADPSTRGDVDRAYLAKYGHGSYGAAMTTDATAQTTLHLTVA